MFHIFDINNHVLFSIPKYNLNIPINILDNMGRNYLSCAEIDNIVDFYPNDGIRQRWIIEKDDIDDIYYIKMTFSRYNHTQYLGAPNKNGQVHLYTSKNIYTKWSINHLQDDKYLIKYVGEKFDKNKVELVIARYNENVEWINAYSDIITLYNKGNDNLDTCIYTVIKLPNYGREGHTYLYHIITNYENLKERTIFSQGSPFEHNDTFLFGVDNCNITLDVQPLGLRWLESANIPTVEYIEKYKTITDYGLIYLKGICDGNLTINDFYDSGIDNIIKEAKKEHPEHKDSDLVLGFLYRSKFPNVISLDNVETSMTKISFTYSALFSVIKSNVHRYDKDVYIRLINELIRISVHGGTNGYVLERLWLFIFDTMK